MPGDEIVSCCCISFSSILEWNRGLITSDCRRFTFPSASRLYTPTSALTPLQGISSHSNRMTSWVVSELPLSHMLMSSCARLRFAIHVDSTTTFGMNLFRCVMHWSGALTEEVYKGEKSVKTIISSLFFF